MRTIAAIPAVALLAGAAAGLVLSDPPLFVAHSLLWGSVICAACAYALRRSVPLASAVALGFFGGGVLLSSAEWQRAWRPPLRVAFEALARAEREEAAREGRRLPEDDEAFAIVEGVLRSDATASEGGVSLSMHVDTIQERAASAPEPFRRASPELAAIASNRSQDGEKTAETAKAAEARHRARARAAAEKNNGNSPRSLRSPRLIFHTLFSRASLEREGFSRATSGGIALTVVGTLADDRIDSWRAGRRVRLPARLRRPARYLDAGVPDHERALARRGTTLVGTVKSGALVEVLARGSPVDEAMGAARAFARRAIAAGVGRWSARSAAIVAAIVIGDRAGLDEPLQRRLQEAGTYHVIAISGGNIAILAGLLVGAFRFAGWLGRTAMLAAIAALAVYAMLVGGGASVNRATLMAVVYFAARAFDQRSPPLNVVALVAALLASADPLSVVDPAFLLTFGATLAILLVLPVLASHRLPRYAAPLAALLAVSVAAEAILFPIGAIAFSRVTFAGLALNFLAIPLMAVAQVAGMLVVPAAAISSAAAAPIGLVAHVGATGLVWSSGLVRRLPLLAYRVASPPWAVVIIYYSTAIAAWVLWRRAPRRSALRRICIAIATVAAMWIVIDPRTLRTSRGDGRLHVTFIDVGQGDSIFVQFPRGSTLLVDAGGLSFSSAFDIGDRVVAPVLRDAAVRRLAYVALTHGDPDHIGGAPSIVDEFRPREVWEGIPVARAAALTALRMEAQSVGARWANVYAGDHVVVDEVDVIARHPGAADWERRKVRNDDSLVLELRWRDVSVLLTGDIGKAVEQTLTSIPPARLRVVKIPHHGSLTSSSPAFVAAVHATVAVVSAGRSNHFGHPVSEVLERYRSEGAEIFRTDQDGAITVDSDGESLEVHTFTGRRITKR